MNLNCDISHKSDQQPLRRPSASRLHRSLCWTLAAVLALSISGCGGCGSGGGKSNDPYAKWGGMSKEEWLKQREEKQKKEKEEEEAAAKQAEAEKQKAETAKQQDATKQAEAQVAAIAAPHSQAVTPPNPPAAAAQPAGAAPAEPPRPEAFSDWKELDFLKARILDDPRLLPALEYYGKSHVGDETAADLLIQLLKPRVMASVRDQMSSEAEKQEELNQRHRLLTQAMVAALGANATAKSRQTLESVIDGSFRTEFDQVATDAAVKALVDNQSPEHEEILFRVLNSAHQMRPPGRGEVTAAALRERVVTSLKPGASSGFRVRLAERLVDPSTSPEMRRTYEDIIREPTTANFEAHVVLYNSSQVDSGLKAEIERQFVQYGSETMGYMLSFPDQRNRFSSTPEWPYRVAERLWSPRVQLLMDARVQPAQSLGEINQVVMLASSVPTAPMRELLMKTLSRHWSEGPGALRTAGFAAGVIHEPGFHPVLKMLLRDAKTGRPELTQAIPRSRLNSVGALVKQRQERDDRVRADWAQAVEDLLMNSFGRYRAIGQAHADAMRREGKPVDFSHVTRDLPVELAPDARVVAAVTYSWPAGIPEKVTGVLHSPMEIHYARIEAKADPEKLSGTYRRKLSGYDVHNVPQGVWFDSLSPGSSPGRQLSVDVVVRLSRPDPLRLPNEVQELVVDILTIELADPAQGGT